MKCREETAGAARAGFWLARTRAAQSGQWSVNQGQKLARSASTSAGLAISLTGARLARCCPTQRPCRATPQGGYRIRCPLRRPTGRQGVSPDGQCRCQDRKSIGVCQDRPTAPALRWRRQFVHRACDRPDQFQSSDASPVCALTVQGKPPHRACAGIAALTRRDWVRYPTCSFPFRSGGTIPPARKA